MSVAKAECEQLLDELMPFAEKRLKEYREFFPFGVVMYQSGEIALTSAYDGREQPPSAKLIELMNEGFRKGANDRAYRATAFAYDALTIPPGKESKQDTVICALDHQDNYAVEVCFPYLFDEEGELIVEDAFGGMGKHEVYGNRTG